VRKHACPEDTADCSALLEMKSILSKLRQKRAQSPELEQTEPEVDQSVEILPNDPSPSVVLKDSSDEQSQSDDSLDFLSTDDDELTSADLLDKVLDRTDRLRPIKKRKKVNFEVIGGGIVPRKTSLSRGPKFTTKDIEFSDQPPRAYAYLEESSLNDMGEWVPGHELSLEEYQAIRDEVKRERYKKFLSSTPYYAFYEDEAAILTDTMVTPLTYNGYYPPITVEDVYIMKMRSPMAPEPPSHPPLINPDWYRPPPAYPYPIPQEENLSEVPEPEMQSSLA